MARYLEDQTFLSGGLGGMICKYNTIQYNTIYIYIYILFLIQLFNLTVFAKVNQKLPFEISFLV